MMFRDYEIIITNHALVYINHHEEIACNPLHCSHCVLLNRNSTCVFDNYIIGNTIYGVCDIGKLKIDYGKEHR